MQRWEMESMNVPASYLASNYALLADREKALEWLERTYAERDPSVIYLNVAPEFDALYSDPRFQALVRRLGLEPQALPLQTGEEEEGASLCEAKHIGPTLLEKLERRRLFGLVRTPAESTNTVVEASSGFFVADGQ